MLHISITKNANHCRPSIHSLSISMRVRVYRRGSPFTYFPFSLFERNYRFTVNTSEHHAHHLRSIGYYGSATQELSFSASAIRFKCILKHRVGIIDLRKFKYKF